MFFRKGWWSARNFSLGSSQLTLKGHKILQKRVHFTVQNVCHSSLCLSQKFAFAGLQLNLFPGVNTAECMGKTGFHQVFREKTVHQKMHTEMLDQVVC